MPHITLPDGVPGISGPMQAYPETAKPMRMLAQALLRGPSSLTEAEREMIATHVSRGNECHFCTSSHAAAARHLLPVAERSVVDALVADPKAAPVSEKLKALLEIAGKVRRDGRLVTAEDVAVARAHGADDQAIHDTVLIAAAFCMFNRYVEGLATWQPDDPAMYDEMGSRLAALGYSGASGERKV